MQLVGFCSVRHQLALADLAGLWETNSVSVGLCGTCHMVPPYPWDVDLLPDPLDAAFHWPPPAPLVTNLGYLQAAKSFCFSQSITSRPGN